MVKSENYRYPEGLSPYPFQREDVDRMDDMPNVLLFSEMGTGKTIETIIHVSETNLHPALVMCPTSLKLNWYDEIEKWTGENPYYCNTADELVEGYFNNLEDVANKGVGRLKWFILHHEALAYVYEDDPFRQMIQTIKWKAIIIDECHRFRNPNTHRTSTLMNLSRARSDLSEDGTKYIFISGTPIVNSTLDLFPMLKIIGKADEEGRFLESYTIGRSTQWGYQVLASKNKDQLLRELAPIYIRRLKSEVLKDLPPKQYQTVKLIMPDDQREVYDHYEQIMCMLLDEGEELTSPNILSLITRLRQLSLDPTILGRKTNSSKTKAVQELIEQSPEEKWVVASTSKMFIKHLEPMLKNALTLTGDDSNYERHHKVKQFTDNPYRKILMTTMFTGGLGLNLQAANNLIVTDPWFNQAMMDQQIDRIHRIGQEKRVMIYSLINEKSIDEDIMKKVTAKAKMANEIVVNQDIIKSIYERTTGVEYTPKPKVEV